MAGFITQIAAFWSTIRCSECPAPVTKPNINISIAIKIITNDSTMSKYLKYFMLIGQPTGLGFHRRLLLSTDCIPSNTQL